MANDDHYYNFRPPPECPVFTPTEEEFSDALGYIAKIRPIAEKSGICKIKPPPDWQPPFAIDVDKFCFVPRIQRLNELEAKSRIKLNFLDQLAKFWELQGTTLRIPNVERKLMDLYALYNNVDSEGGYDYLTKERKWSKVASAMGYPSGKGIGPILRAHYERMLYPFFVFKKGKSVVDKKEKVQKVQLKTEPQFDSEGETEDCPDHDYKPNRKNKRAFKEAFNILQEAIIDYSANNELRKLQFFGAGPKAAVPTTPVKDEGDDIKDFKDSPKMKTREKGPISYLDQYICHKCNRGDGEEYMLLCDGCDDAFHTYCLIPPLPDIPKGDWRCPRCVQQVCNKPLAPYGFEQSQREYSLQSFGEMADQFKSDYFNMPVHKISCAQVEKEFWRLVNTTDENVVVQYGADIHAAEMGSGFPVQKNKDDFPDDKEYVSSDWNLNNLAVLDQSVLGHINADISGMKIPWCYVGMCFSSFCWHNEDHWSYSINYMHWGEPKTWYGVPGKCAELLESAMQKMAPELFENTPDLLHQLTTMMNPNILMEHGVPICRTNQCAGDFIITFPRAYHAGFNQGYNFAEAVNFCPADWLPIGRNCIENYRTLHRQCVFSHEELICKLAANPDSLDFNLAAATHEDLLALVEVEKKQRKHLLERGTVEAEREAFELLPDDERQCMFCKTTCFLSGVTCPCSPNKVVCIHDVDELCLCHPSKHCLRYRYTLDELPTMLLRLKVRAESYDNWLATVQKALDATDDSDKLDISELRDLITEAEDKHFPETEVFQSLSSTVSEAEKCATVAQQLVSKKVRTRNRQSGEGKYMAKLSLEELKCFYEQVECLPCIIREVRLIKELLNRVSNFQSDAQNALSEEMPDSDKLKVLIEFGITLDVDLSEITKLKQVLQQALWLDEVRMAMQDPQNVTLDTMRRLLDSGVGLAPHPALEKAMADLQELLTISERWEEKARICLQARPRHMMATLDAIILEASEIPAYLPNVSALSDALRKAKDWTTKVDAVQNGDHYPYLEMLESLVNKGRPIPVRLDALPQVESQVAASKSWRERTARTFLKKNSTYSLVEILSPRTDIGVYNNNKMKKKKVKEGEKEKERRDKDCDNNNSLEEKVEEHCDPATIVAAFKVSEQREVEMMRELRQRNMEKICITEEEDIKYCICRRGKAGQMLQCELCKDWFHGTCVPLPKSTNMKSKSSQAAAVQAARELKFLCPLCLRSRRPRLETILSLLVSLQKLPVRLPEGEALQCLTERAMAWQDRARQSLATSELASALAKLSMLSQRMVEQAAREKTEKIINAELMKAASNPELQGHLASVTHSAFGGAQSLPFIRESSVLSMDADSSQSIPFSPASPLQSEDSQMDSDASNFITGMSEHAYSSASKTNPAASPRKHQRKTPLVARQLEAPVLELSSLAKVHLEELMMEGDILEVSLDETQHIWRILQACQPKSEEKFMEMELDLPDFPKERSLKDPEMKVKEKKKRKKIIGEDGVEIIRIKKLKNGLNNGEKIKIKKRKPKIPEAKDGEKDSNVNIKYISVSIGEDGKVKKTEKGEKPKKKRIKPKLDSTMTPDDMKKKVKRVKKTRVKKEAMLNDADEENAEDDCSAVKCLKPSGDEVKWVQCDKCELWFHLLCIGLGDDEVNDNDDYICFKCNPSNRNDHVSNLLLELPQHLSMNLNPKALGMDSSVDFDTDNSTNNDFETVRNLDDVSVVKNGIGETKKNDSEVRKHKDTLQDLYEELQSEMAQNVGVGTTSELPPSSAEVSDDDESEISADEQLQWVDSEEDEVAIPRKEVATIADEVTTTEKEVMNPSDEITTEEKEVVIPVDEVAISAVGTEEATKSSADQDFANISEIISRHVVASSSATEEVIEMSVGNAMNDSLISSDSMEVTL